MNLQVRLLKIKLDCNYICKEDCVLLTFFFHYSLFEKNADAIKFFKQFDSATTLTDLRNNKLLESHVRGVMFTIDEAITTLDDADSVINMLLKVGKGHFRFDGFDPNVFLVS